MKLLGALAIAAVFAAGCSTDTTPGPDGGSGGVVVTIGAMAFTPLDFTVDAGTTITVRNTDTTAHSMTSESADNAFTFSAVNGVEFDIDVPAASGTAGGPSGSGGGNTPGETSFQIPATAPSGTVIPYFCTIHKASMTTPNGHITIR